MGDYQRALGYFEQSLIIKREIGDQRGEGIVLGNLGNVYAHLGDARCAIGYYEQAVEISREIGDINSVASVSFNIALLYQQQGDPTHALSLAQEAVRLFTQIGHTPNAQRAQKIVTRLQGSAPASDGDSESNEANDAQAAFEAFQRASSRDDMQQAMQRCPFMTNPQFIAAIENIIKEKVPPQAKPAFQQRLDWLKSLAR